MIEYNIGDSVAPVIDVIVNNITYYTTGVSGNVLNRTLRQISETEEDFYNYQVNFPVPPSGVQVTGSGSETVETVVFQNNLWFTEEDLGGRALPNAIEFDLNAAQQTVDASKVTSSTAVAIVTGVKDTLNTASVVYDSVATLTSTSLSHDSILQSQQISGEDEGEITRSAAVSQTSGELLAYDQLMIQEVVENYSELAAVLEETEAEIKAESEQAKSNELAGNLEDEAALSAYFEATQATQGVFGVSPDVMITEEEEELTLYDPDYLLPEQD